MTAHGQNEKEQELQNREKALRDRELALRLKELEVEIHAKAKVQNHEIPIPPLYSEPVDRSLKYRFKQFLKWSKIIGCTLLGLTLAFVGIFVGVWLIYIALLSGVVYIGYYLLFGKNRANRP